MIAAWLSQLGDLLLPAGCLACGIWLPDPSRAVCPGCRASLREAPWPRCPRCHHPLGTGRLETRTCSECSAWPSALTEARYAVVLDGAAPDLVHGLKYEGWREIAATMIQYMERIVGQIDPDAVLVPVPTTPRRARVRGYNQAELLAQGLASRTGRRLASALTRVPAGPSQTALGREERRANVAGAFRALPGAPAFGGRPVALVDDVITTGATAGEAAETLARAGAGPVVVVAFARALPLRRREAA